jgi:hypothetical protein
MTWVLLSEQLEESSGPSPFAALNTEGLPMGNAETVQETWQLKVHALHQEKAPALTSNNSELDYQYPK